MGLARHQTPVVRVRGVELGGANLIRIQSMTDTDTSDVEATVAQVLALARAGSELVRVTVNNDDAARALPEIRSRIGEIPLVGDFHYNGHVLLERYPTAVRALDKIRINPGTVAGGGAGESFEAMLEIAKRADKPIRIGANWGSLERALLDEFMDRNARRDVPKSAQEVEIEALAESALSSAERARAYGIPRERLVVSAKVSVPSQLYGVYRAIARDSRGPYALHLGLTEAGMGDEGVVKSAVALAPLLLEGIGDTIRISLTPGSRDNRTREVEVAKLLLQHLGLRQYSPGVTSCPGCGRTTSKEFQVLTEQTRAYVDARLDEWKQSYGPDVLSLSYAVMGCVVNGPGESRRASLGLSLPGTGESPRCPVYRDGKLHTILEGNFLTIRDNWFALIERDVLERFSHPGP